MKKDYKLTKEEQQILDDFERGEFVSVPNLKEAIKEAIQTAKNTTQKKRNINLRVSEKTLHKLKVKAAEEGLPYQTLASSILHKYANK